MSSYLLDLQRAITQTNMSTHEFGDRLSKDGYSVGWHDAQDDLEYGLKLSETACQEHILHWLAQPDTVLEADKGYYDRIVEINNFMEEMK